MQYFVIIEQKVINGGPGAIIRDFSKAIMMWFVSHYVFHLMYDKTIKEVALFIQEYVFGLSDTQSIKKSATYWTVSTGIKNFV